MEIEELEPMSDVEESTEPELEPPPPPPDPEQLYEDLRQAVLQAAGWEDDPPAALDALGRAQEALSSLAEVLADLEAPPDLVLPPFRQAGALFVVSPGDAERVPDVAEALDIDAATARQVAVVQHPRVALRSNDRDLLEQRASRYRVRLALPARVLDQDDLRAQPPARLVLTLAAAGPWRSAISPSWEPESGVLAKLRMREDPPLPLRLVVVGEVVKQRFREHRGRRKDDVRLASHGERRRGVIDLHHDGGVLRVIEGVTSLEGWEGLDPRSSALAFRGLPDLLAQRYPAIPHTGRLVCRPTRQPEARDDGRIESTGWPAWEEHSRACRCLYLGT